MPSPDSCLHAARAYWEVRAALPYGDQARLRWLSAENQAARFDAWLALCDVRGHSVLDVGCGLGDLYRHLTQRGIPCGYVGIDLSPTFIEECRDRYPEGDFLVGDLESLAAPPFDYVVAFGIHNIDLPGVEELALATLAAQYARSRLGAWATFLDDQPHRHRGDLHSYSPFTLLAIARTITPYVVLRTDAVASDVALGLFTGPGFVELHRR